MADLGYMRISTGQQTHDQQREALLAAGISPERIFQDTISGVRQKRPGLDALLAYAREGDTVTVLRLDRLGRSVAHSLATVEQLTERGISLRSLKEGIDLTTAAGRFQMVVFAAVAEMERELMLERLQEARVSTEAKGGRWGRPPALTPEQVNTARAMRAAGLSIATIATTLDVSRATAYRFSEPVEAA